VTEVRGLGEPSEAAWVALRKGRGRPLSYATFESQLRALSRRVGVSVTPHMFRHALAQALVHTAGLKVAQEVLGHAHVSTTAASYARVDMRAMVSALGRVNAVADLAARRDRRLRRPDADAHARHRAPGADLQDGRRRRALTPPPVRAAAANA
jgi:site-specific recombinase XerC